jgi:succinate dehydrogenase / fumarate reductase cytochrome b subunit
MSKILIRTRRPWDIGTWVWLLNRIAGVTIIVYLILHIFVIGTTRSGSAAFEGVMRKLHDPVALFLEFVLIMAVLAHGLNGLRHILIDFGLVVPNKHVSLLVGAGVIGVLVFFIAIGLLIV